MIVREMMSIDKFQSVALLRKTFRKTRVRSANGHYYYKKGEVWTWRPRGNYKLINTLGRENFSILLLYFDGVITEPAW